MKTIEQRRNMTVLLLTVLGASVCIALLRHNYSDAQVMGTTIGLTVVILGKDLLLTPRRSRTWNIVLAAFCLVLLFWGRLTLGLIEADWGIIR